MADEAAKSNFNDILSNLKRKFEITDSKWTDDKLYEIKFRTQIAVENEDYNKHCDQWVDEFSFVTDTIWVHKISNTGSKVKFRKQYQCWTYESKEVNKEILFDARRCRGTLNIKVLGYTSGLKKTNRYMRLGLNVLIKIDFQHLHPVKTDHDYSFFVHWCKPLSEAPKPAAPSDERVSQLVAKVVENAPITSQKAVERAKEALKKQCIAPPKLNQKVTQTIMATQVQESTSFVQLPTENGGNVVIGQPPMTQVIISNADAQTSDSVFYVHQVVFDSATQTLREVVPASSNEMHSLPYHQLIQVQMPTETTHVSSIVSVQSNEHQNQHF